jgi:tripartite-type tricarboxylate transporter receptor subunit TctC
MRLIFAAVMTLLAAVLSPVNAQEWPAKTVTIIVPFTAGGTADLFARLLAANMQQKLGASFIVENRSGAGGNIGAAAVAKSPNDGYTLLLGTVSTHAINQFMYSNMQFDPAKDFQPISLIARLPNVLVVNPKIPAKTPAELVTYLKANPNKITYASSGVGTSIHLAAELFKIKTGTTMTHVPYRSSGEVMQNVTAGHVDLAFDNMTLAWPQAQSGNVRALAVTSLERSPTAPNIPTMDETFKGFEATSWHGLFAPAGTPKPIVDKLAAEVKRILDIPENKEKLMQIGAVASPMTPDEFTAFIATERAKWEPVVVASGAKAQ